MVKAEDGMHAPAPPQVRPIMLHHWRWLTFLHWRYPAGVVQSRLPEGLTVETFDGSAWVGLIPFLMDDVRAPRLPALPWLSRFPETNVRTYVRGPDGRTGIWFMSLDADRLPAVVAARTTYGLPYFWSSMSVRRAGDQVIYRARRRWPGRAGVRCDARVELGAAWRDGELTTLDHFLTARYRLYSTLGGMLVAADAEHPRWPLRRVTVRQLRQDLLQAAGLPEPDHDPVLHASDGVRVRIGGWRAV
jgi:uncharacterized protein YqjF (DUF2071 family)